MNYKKVPENELREWFSDMQFKTKPFYHQLVSLAFTLGENLNSVMLAHDIGTGKTLTALYLLQCWFVQGSVLIVSPNSVISTWKEQIEKHTDFTYEVLDGNTKQQRIKKLITSKAQLFIINYEGLRAVFGKKVTTKKGKTKFVKNDFSFPFEALICDESHRLKNPASLQSKITHILSTRIRYKILMTGTPVARSVQDLFGQYLVLDNGKTLGSNYWFFLNDYFYKPAFQWEPKRICKICGKMYCGKKSHLETHNLTLKDYRERYGSEDETTENIILEKVKPITIRYSREECVDLPEKVYQIRNVNPTRLQLTTMNEIIENMDFHSIPVNKIEYHCTKLIQITSGIILKNGNLEYEFKDNPKLKELTNIIGELDGKYIIYHQFIEEGHLIEKQLDKIGINYQVINGSKSNKEKETAIHTFQNDKRCTCMIAHPKSGGEGLNMQVANTIIFFSNGFIGTILREQAEGRIWRAGQTKKCLFIDIVMKDTLDETLYNSLKNKVDYAENVLDFLKNSQKNKKKIK